MGKPSAPAAPDYAAAATAQGQANVASAQATNYLNQVNQVTPYGSLTYSYGQPSSGGSTSSSTPNYANIPGVGNINIPGVTSPGATGSGGTSGGVNGNYISDGAGGQTFIPQVTATTTLSPAEQTLFDQNNALSTSLNNLAGQGLQYVQNATSNPLTANQFAPVQNAPTAGPVQSSYNFSNAPAMPSTSDFQEQSNQLTQAILQRLQPQLDQQNEQLNSQLANQGINLGSGAYSDAQYNNQRGINDLQLGAISTGDQEQQALYQEALAGRQQGVSEAEAQGNFGNQAQQQLFNQGLASSQANNQAQQQAIQEASFFQNNPLNVLNALRSGNQVTTPTFGNVSGGSTIQAAPIYQAAVNQNQANQAAYQTQMSGFGSLLSGLGTIGGAALMA